MTAIPSAIASAQELLSPFANITAVIRDHTYRACFGGLVDDALVYTSGFAAVKSAAPAWPQLLHPHPSSRKWWTTCFLQEEAAPM